VRRDRVGAWNVLRRRRGRGFTLVEVLVALTVAGLAVLLAAALVGGLADRARALVTARTALDRRMNARRSLAAAFLSLEVGTDGAGGFEGEADRVTFTTRLRTPDGWFERRRLRLALGAGRVVAVAAPEDTVTLWDSVAAVAFDYLLEPGLDARWVRQWVSPVTAPLAVRMRIAPAVCTGAEGTCATDTILFLVKERG
jgi:prepilin-type N-terminal cleavage/methylation domain-containing protein